MKTTERRTALRRRLVALATLSALALVLAVAGRSDQAVETLRYRVEVTTPGASAPAEWHLYQGADGVSLVPPSQPPHPMNAWAIVEPGPEADPLMVRSRDEQLLPVWRPQKVYAEPKTEVEAKSSTLVLRDLRWELIRGSSDRSVAGRPTEHYVFTATLKIQARPAPGLEGLGEDSVLVTSRTDLWIDGGRPFSWAPFALWGNRALSVGEGAADAYLRRQAGPRLEELGFPLLMQTRLTYRPYGDPDFTFGNDARTRVRVTEIQPADGPAVPARFLRYSRSSASQ